MARNRNNSNGTHGEEVPKVKLTKENLKEVLLIFSYLKPYRKRFITGLVFIALSGATTMSFPYMLKKLIDSAHEIGMGSIATPPGVIATIMVCILGVQMIFSFSRIYLFTSVGENALADMRSDV